MDAVTSDGGANVLDIVIDNFETFNLGNVYVTGLTEGNEYDFTIEVFYNDGVKTSNVKGHDVPVYPTETTIEAIFDKMYTGNLYYKSPFNEAPGNVRVQYNPGANNDFTFVSANMDAVTSGGGANVLIDNFDSGNVYVDGLTEGNVYDFTIEVFYENNNDGTKYETSTVYLVQWNVYNDRNIQTGYWNTYGERIAKTNYIDEEYSKQFAIQNGYNIFWGPASNYWYFMKYDPETHDDDTSVVIRVGSGIRTYLYGYTNPEWASS